MSSYPHITVCICTYRRSHLLKNLLVDIRQQETQDQFTYSVVVVDNDHLKSAEETVVEAQKASAIPIKYCLEPRQNIARARNKAIENVEGDYVAFIDDDERPTTKWLLTLFTTCQQYAVDGVLGPVKPHFEFTPPAWIVKGKFYERPSYPTGFVIDGPKGRTGNVLLKKQLFALDEQPFNPELLTGEDQDFFRKMIERGHVFVWCEQAVAYEIVPASRWKRSFMLRRALLRGKISLVQPTSGVSELLKSVVAVPAYALALPFLLFLGHEIFMRYLIKTFDHAGRLLALVGLNPIKGSYVTE